MSSRVLSEDKRAHLRKERPQVKRDATVIERSLTSLDWWCQRRHSFVHTVLTNPRRFHLDLEDDRHWRIVTNSYWATVLDLSFRCARFSRILCSAESLHLHRQWHQRQNASEEFYPSAFQHRSKPISLHSDSCKRDTSVRMTSTNSSTYQLLISRKNAHPSSVSIALVVERNCAIKSSRLLVVMDRNLSIKSSSRLDMPPVDDIASESTSIVHNAINEQIEGNRKDLEDKRNPSCFNWDMFWWMRATVSCGMRVSMPLDGKERKEKKRKNDWYVCIIALRWRIRLAVIRCFWYHLELTRNKHRKNKTQVKHCRPFKKRYQDNRIGAAEESEKNWSKVYLEELTNQVSW